MSATTRRGAIELAVTALVAGRATPASAASPDAELIALCADYFWLDEPIAAWDAELGDDLDEATVTAILTAKANLLPLITKISARTDTGLVAKARVTVAEMRYAETTDSRDRNDLVRSVLADIIGRAGA